MKKSVAAIVSIIFIFNCFCMVSKAGTGDIRLTINGYTVKNMPAPLNINGRLMLPLRAVMESMGLRIQWIKEEMKVAVKDDSTAVELFIGKNTAKVNGKTVAVEASPIIVNDIAMIPARFVTEIFNRKIEYDNETKTVNIDSKPAGQSKVRPPLLVAHAGGEIGGITYTNCLEAIENSLSKGINTIEIDFSYTSDQKIVLLHTWDGFIEKFFNRLRGCYSYDEFKGFKMFYGWHQMTLEDLIAWMREHEDAVIVTDTKENNIKLLQEISLQGKDVIDRFIPQIYSPEEYNTAKELGYSRIIFTLYRSGLPNEDIIEFARENELYAVTMPEARAAAGLAKNLSNIGVFTYCHTINDVKTAEMYIRSGIDGFYTDSLTEDSFK